LSVVGILAYASFVEHEITWGGDPEDVIVTTWGTATIEGLNAWVQEGLADPRYRPGLRVLIDQRKLDWSELSLKDVQQRIELFVSETARLDHARAAVVMGAPVDFGIARMEQAYVELHPELKFEIGVFLSIEKAREWLREEAAQDSPADS